MGRSQWIAVMGSIIVLFVLYFGCEKTQSQKKAKETQSAKVLEATSIENLLLDATKGLTKEDKTIIEALNIDLEKVANDTIQSIQILKSISSAWYSFGHKAIAGHYAEEVATLVNSDVAWAIAGTTYAEGIMSEKDEKTKTFAFNRAIASIEKAISMAPDSIQYRVNLALCYIEKPTQAQPMQGIMMLVDLNKQYPNNVMVLNQLGRLAIQTQQWDKAIARLEAALNIEPNNKNTICLLAKAYEQSGKDDKAKEFSKKCIQ